MNKLITLISLTILLTLNCTSYAGEFTETLTGSFDVTEKGITPTISKTSTDPVAADTGSLVLYTGKIAYTSSDALRVAKVCYDEDKITATGTETLLAHNTTVDSQALSLDETGHLCATLAPSTDYAIIAFSGAAGTYPAGKYSVTAKIYTYTK